jgi:hypothetical protein
MRKIILTWFRFGNWNQIEILKYKLILSYIIMNCSRLLFRIWLLFGMQSNSLHNLLIRIWFTDNYCRFSFWLLFGNTVKKNAFKLVNTLVSINWNRFFRFWLLFGAQSNSLLKMSTPIGLTICFSRFYFRLLFGSTIKNCFFLLLKRSYLTF